MPDKPEAVVEGDRLSAARTNLVTDAAFRNVSGNAPGMNGPDGFAFRQEEQFPEPYAKAQSDWEENDGDPKVSVKMCDADGGDVRGPAFDVYLPRRRSSPEDNDPDVYTGDVIRWEWDYEGRRVCTSPYLAAEIVSFKLQEALVDGSSAAAYVLEWDTDTGDYLDPETTAIAVEDFLHLGLVGPADCQGRARRRSGTDTYEVTYMQPIASMLSALVNEGGNVLASDSTFNVDDVAIIAPPGAIYPTGSAPTVCNNALGVPAADDAKVMLFYNHATGLWEGFPFIYTTACP